MTTVYMNRLDEIAVQTLIVHGEQDSLVSVHYAEEAHARIRSSQLSIISEAGHWPQREKPEEFYEVFSGFLAK